MKYTKENTEAFEKILEKLLKHNLFRMNNSLSKIFLISLVRGLASGLGWIIGATILVSVLTYMLSQIEFVPILGDWVSSIIEQIEKFERSKINN